MNEEEILATLAEVPLTPAVYQRLARGIESIEGAQTRVHLLSSFSAQFLVPYLRVEAYRLGLRIEATLGPFGQFEQELHDERSGLWVPGTRVVVVLMRPEDVDPALDHSPPAAAPAEHLAAVRERLLGLLRELRRRTTAVLLVANAAPPSALDASYLGALGHAVLEHNLLLAQAIAQISDAHVFDWAGAVADYGASRFEDRRLWYLGRVACGAEASAVVARRLARHLGALLLPRAKCVVVDLDDTLWGGVLADDGIEGIQLGDDYPGNVFKDFQRRLKDLSGRGVLLAVASKNHEPLAREAFDRHPEMVLRWEDFAALRINWNPKAQSLREIAQELNIGIESLVFLDNDPVECASVRAEAREVTVACLGRDPLGFERILSGIAALDRVGVTAEDEGRARMYQGERHRREQQVRAQSRAEFLAGLAMKATVGLCDATTLPRIVQLIGKTNQFNLTTRRRGMEDVRALAGAASSRVGHLRLADAYGDLGLACVGILRQDETAADWLIDTFLMSCRVMGRGVEEAFLSYLGECARGAGASRLIGEYLPSAKNGIVSGFYSEHGFRPQAGEDGGRRFVIELSGGALPWPSHIVRIV